MSLKTLASIILASSTAGCYVTGSDIVGVALKSAIPYIENPIVSTVTDKAGDLSLLDGRRGHEVKRAKAGATTINIGQQDRISQPIHPEKPQYNIQTQKVIDQIFGDKSVDYTLVIDKIKIRCKNRLFDYERNLRIIDNTLNLEELTSNDKSRLIEIANNLISKETLSKQIREAKKDRLNYSPLKIRNMQKRFLEGTIKTCEFLINRPELDPKSRIEKAKTYSCSITGYIHSNKISGQKAINLLRNKIEMFENLKDKIKLTDEEIKWIYKDCTLSRHYPRGAIHVLEVTLRKYLSKQNPKEFKRKKQIFENMVKDYRTKKGIPHMVKFEKYRTKKETPLEHTEIMKLAKEIGYSAWLRYKIKGR